MKLNTLGTILGALDLANVHIEEFADPEKRKEWIDYKNMQVFSLASYAYPDTTVDVCAREPFAFEAEHAAAEVHESAPGVSLPLVRPSTLIAMKQEVNRSSYQDDVQHLRWIMDGRNEEKLHE